MNTVWGVFLDSDLYIRYILCLNDCGSRSIFSRERLLKSRKKNTKHSFEIRVVLITTDSMGPRSKEKIGKNGTGTWRDAGDTAAAGCVCTTAIGNQSKRT